jgi:hypothetical protein
LNGEDAVGEEGDTGRKTMEPSALVVTREMATLLEMQGTEAAQVRGREEDPNRKTEPLAGEDTEIRGVQAATAGGGGAATVKVGERTLEGELGQVMEIT